MGQPSGGGGGGVPFWVLALLLLVVQTGFGAYSVLVRKLAQGSHANAVFFSFLRDGCCFPVLFAAALAFERTVLYPESLGELALFLSLGFTGIFAGQLNYILGIYYASPNVASIYQPAMPVWASVLVILVGVEPIPAVTKLRGSVKVASILLASGGALLMILGKESSKVAMLNPLLGNICSLLNTVFSATYVTIQKYYLFNHRGRFAERWGGYPTWVTAWAYFFGALFMISAGLLGYAFDIRFFGFGGSLRPCESDAECNPGLAPVAWRSACSAVDGRCRLLTSTLRLPEQSIGVLVYAVLVTSALCYGLISFANKHASTSAVTAFWPFQVVVAIVLSYFVFGDVVTGPQIGGAAMIVTGLFGVILGNRLQEHHDAQAARLPDERSSLIQAPGS